MSRPNRKPHRLADALPPSRRESLTPERRRDLADLGADLDRKAHARSRIGLPGGARCPIPLEPVEAVAPGAARLYVSLDGMRFTAEDAVEVGSYLELDAAAVAVALDALRRAELLGGPPEAMVTLPSASAPF